jgi:hypothetical protein
MAAVDVADMAGAADAGINHQEVNVPARGLRAGTFRFVQGLPQRPGTP